MGIDCICFPGNCFFNLILLHSGRPKLYTTLACLSAKGLYTILVCPSAKGLHRILAYLSAK